MKSPDAIADSSSSFALVIGISHYSDPAIPDLKFTKADAMALYKHLISKNHIGLASENIKLLLDEDATLYRIKNAVSGWLFQKVTDESTVVIYFAGHGGQESDKTGTESDGIAKYLLPYDCDRNDLFSSALSNSEFSRLMKTIRAKRLIFFMDACYAGGVTRSGARDVGVVEDMSSKLAQGEGRLVIASAKPNQRSWEDEKIGHGIFTYHLLEALEGKADFDNDGYVSVWEVFRYLEKNVPVSARQLAHSLQEPLLCGDISKDIYLTANQDKVNKLKLELKQRLEEQLSIRKGKQEVLFKIFINGDMPSEVYRNCLTLLEKDPEEYSTNDRKLIPLLNALLQNAFPLSSFLEMHEAIHEMPKPAPLPTLFYCNACGTRLTKGLIFCTNCGKRIDSM